MLASFSSNGNAPFYIFRRMLALLAQSREALQLSAAKDPGFHVQAPWQPRNRMGITLAETMGRLLRVGFIG